MSQFKVSRGALPADQYTIVTNDFQRGKLPVPVRCVARCLLGYLLSLPADWDMDRVQLDASVVEGRDAVDSGLKELERAGYLRRVRWHDKADGTWRWSWRVTDDPIARPLPASPSPANQGLDPISQNTASPQVGPSPGNPGAETQGISEDGVKKTDRNSATAGAAETPATPLSPAIPEQTPGPQDRTPTQRAVLLAQAHYERLGKMGNVPAMMKIIRKALEHGYSDESVDLACTYIGSLNWTLTEEKLANTLRGGPKRPSNGAPIARRPQTAGARPAGARPASSRSSVEGI